MTSGTPGPNVLASAAEIEDMDADFDMLVQEVGWVVACHISRFAITKIHYYYT